MIARPGTGALDWARANEQDSQVEIDAKIAAGYFGGAKDVKSEDLHLTVGRAWEDLEH